MRDCCIRTTPEGGGVGVETRRFADVTILRVRDHGPGISANEVPSSSG